MRRLVFLMLGGWELSVGTFMGWMVFDSNFFSAFFFFFGRH